MRVPVRLYRRASDGAIVEAFAPGESGTLLYGAGAELIESVAQASGVSAYLAGREARAKAVAQAEVEDKAVAPEEVEDKAVSRKETEDKGLGRGAGGRFERRG